MIFTLFRRCISRPSRLACLRTWFREPEGRTGLALTIRLPRRSRRCGTSTRIRNSVMPPPWTCKNHAGPMDHRGLRQFDHSLERSPDLCRAGPALHAEASRRPAATGLQDRCPAAFRHRLCQRGKSSSRGDRRRTARGSESLVSRGRHKRWPHLAVVCRCARWAGLCAAGLGAVAVGRSHRDWARARTTPNGASAAAGPAPVRARVFRA